MTIHIRQQKMTRDGIMKKSIALAVWSLLAILAAQLPAQARQTLDALSATQFRKGMAAFNRQNFTVAGALLRLPAERGDSRAQATLCYLHTHGRGVPQSFPEAANWCRRSAEQGNAQGQYMLGLLYNSGHGVPESFVQAYMWLNLAAAHAAGPKREFSYRIRDSVASKMSPAQIAKAQALAVEYRPAPELPGSALLIERCVNRHECRENP
jgi:TPR repeat protein